MGFIILKNYSWKVSRKTEHSQNTKSSISIDNLPIAYLEFDNALNINDFNTVTEELFCYSSVELRNMVLGDLISLSEKYSSFNAFWERMVNYDDKKMNIFTFKTKKDKEIKCKCYFKPVFDGSGKISSIICLLSDVTEKVNNYTDLKSHADYDPLTNLPSRRLIGDRIQQAIYSAERHNKSMSIMFLDLDGFKQVNDSFGHKAGDDILKEVAKRLVLALRKNDTVIRIGGDEFVVINTDIRDPSDAIPHIASKIITSISSPFIYEDNLVNINVSIGVSVFSDNKPPQQYINEADEAMYKSKSNGKGTYTVYQETQGVS
jgi:diguanylate cyclase (GGDEF)-like protein/PAS domain S-box-containing protein